MGKILFADNKRLEKKVETLEDENGALKDENEELHGRLLLEEGISNGQDDITEALKLENQRLKADLQETREHLAEEEEASDALFDANQALKAELERKAPPGNHPLE